MCLKQDIGQGKNTDYFIKLVMNGEDSLIGLDSMSDKSLLIQADRITVYSMNFELKHRMRDCHEHVFRITPCIKDFYEKEYGNDFKNQSAKLYDELFHKYGGYDQIINRTGCLKPCQETKYLLQEFTSGKPRNMLDPNIHKFLNQHNEITQVPMVIFKHEVPRKMVYNNEVYEYDTTRIISEAGGIVGIFVGLSFWSIYSDFVLPILTRVGKYLEN